MIFFVVVSIIEYNLKIVSWAIAYPITTNVQGEIYLSYPGSSDWSSSMRLWWPKEWARDPFKIVLDLYKREYLLT